MNEIGRGVGAVSLVLACFATPALAQSGRDASPDGYPSRPVRIVVGNPPGGGVDLVARLIGQKLFERWGHPVVIDNRPGAAGVISMDLVASAAPDGHTLLGGSGSMILLGVRKKVSYDIRKAFVPVAQMSTTPYLLVVTPSLPVQSVKELIAYARAKSLSYGSSGTGSAVHLAMELFSSMTGVQMVHVPYKGSSQSLIDVAGGRVQLVITNILSATPLVKSGQLKALAVTSLRRTPAFPALPSVAESGVPGFDVTNSYLLYVPEKTSANVVTVLHRELARVTASPDLKQRLAAEGAETGASASLPELKQDFIRQVDLWEKFINSSGVKLAD